MKGKILTEQSFRETVIIMNEEKNTVKNEEIETEIPSEDKKQEKEDKKASKKDISKLQKEVESVKKELAKVKKDFEAEKEQNNALNDRYVRMMAEYENYRKRASSEKDGIYANAVTDVLTQILPLADALEMALKYGGDGEQVTKGIEMTLTKLSEILEKMGVSPIEAKTFDPNFHNAVMHVEDENFGEGEIVEVFQKGYKKGDKIIRYAMVKVAN